MSEIYIVLARFESYDAPLFGGTRGQCQSFCKKHLKGSWQTRKADSQQVWRSPHHVLRDLAKRVLHHEMDSDCVALHTVRMRPGPPDTVDQYTDFNTDVQKDQGPKR